jgi:hypothetical protein
MPLSFSENKRNTVSHLLNEPKGVMWQYAVVKTGDFLG